MPERGSQEDIDRHMQAMPGLLNGLSFRDCNQGTYGDEESDYSEEELEAADKDLDTYYDSLVQDVKLKGDPNND
jgi:hypothetical protein